MLQGIRKRLLIGGALLAAMALGVCLPLAMQAIERSSRALELRDAQGDAVRLQRMLATRLESFAGYALDYGNWNLSADYLRGLGATDFVPENFYPDNMRLIGADFMILARPDLSIDTSLAMPAYVGGDASGGDLLPMPAALPRLLLADPSVRALLARPGAFSAFRHVEGRWYQVGFSSVTYPGQQPPGIYGLLGFVKEVDERHLAAMAELVGARFEFLDDDSRLPLEASIVGNDIVSVQRLEDSTGHAGGLVRFAYPRPLQRLSADARRVLAAGIALIFLLGGALTLFYVDRHLIRRLQRMDDELTGMIQGHAGGVTTGQRDDEIDRLGLRINALHDELSDTTRRWRHEAHHDALTDLGNRILLMRVLEDELADPARLPLALLLLDLDGFKPVNDLYGHAVGDRVLSQVAQRIRDALPAQAQAFRLGGDEFAVVCPDMDEPAALATALRLNSAIAARGVQELRGAGITTSIGIAVGRHDAAGVEEMIQHADIALYEVKRKQRNGAAIYDDALHAALAAERELERDLREGLASQALQAWFQPIVAAADGRVLGFEALARWRHPRLGWVPPERFVELAERTGLVPQIDLLVLRQALDALAAIGEAAAQARMSVNVSAQSLLDPHYCQSVPQLLARSRIPPQRLVLELTESLLMSNEAMLDAPLDALRTHGIGLLLDDFGVGNSSLSRLARLAPDGIKLDGSFVRNREGNGERICRAIVGLATQLQIPVTAEFVANQQDIRDMRDAGCHALQGYAIGAPMPLPELQAWLKSRAGQAVA